jgi:hypothetical protein
MKIKRSVRDMDAKELMDAIKNCIANGHTTDAVLRTRYAKWIVVKRTTAFDEFYLILVEMMEKQFHRFGDNRRYILFESIRRLIRRAVQRKEQINFIEPPKYDPECHQASLNYWAAFCSQFMHPGP